MNRLFNKGILPANSYTKSLGGELAEAGAEDSELGAVLIKILNREFGRTEATQESILSQLKLLESFLFPAILEVSFNPNESKVFSHTLGRIPTQRIILRQTGNGVITDVNPDWNKETVGFRNNGTVAVTATIALR